MEIFWKSRQVVRTSQTVRPSPPPILRGSGSGSGSGGGEENALLPLPQPPPPLPLHPSHQEQEMVSWPHHHLRQDYVCSKIIYSTPATNPQSSVSLEPPPLPPTAPYVLPAVRPTGQLRGIQGNEEARGSTSRTRSRAAEMHNLAERRRREKINEKMKTLQELLPRCNKSTKVSTLDGAIEYVKSLQSQIQMISMGQGMMPSMMNEGNMQEFMPHMAMKMMGMNKPPFIPSPGTPFPRPAQMAGVGPSPSYPAPRYPFPNIQTFDPSRVRLPSPVVNQPHFPAYMNPYSQFVGHHQMQQPPPPLQSQTTPQLSSGQASSSKEPEDKDSQPKG